MTEEQLCLQASSNTERAQSGKVQLSLCHTCNRKLKFTVMRLYKIHFVRNNPARELKGQLDT